MGTEQIVARAQGGDRAALAQLIEAHQTQIYSLSLAIMRNPADAADMTQETFVRVIRALNTYRGDRASFATWVHRRAVNVCLDALRRRKHAPVELAQPADVLAEDGWAEPEAAVTRHEQASEVRAALELLPRSQRRALTLYYFEDKPYQRIAELMALPINTVKSHLLRGKQKLARMPRLSLAAA